MSVEELLGDDNQARLKKLAKGMLPQITDCSPKK